MSLNSCFHEELNVAKDKDDFTNPVLSLSLGLAAKLNKGEINLEELEKTIDERNIQSLKTRSQLFKNKIGELNVESNRQILSDLLRGLAKSTDFDGFKQLIERVSYGVVLTAHPTFTLNDDAYNDLENYIVDGIEPKAISIPQGVSLDEEFTKASEAVSMARFGLEQLLDVVFDVTSELFPGREIEITPCPVNIANWVGFDLDGRSDITWQSSFIKRLQLARDQQVFYLSYLEREFSGSEIDTARLRSVCQAKKERFDEDINAFQECANVDDLQKMFDARPPAHSVSLESFLNDLLNETPNPKSIKKLLILRSFIKIFGDGSAKIHVRLNSLQLHNAIRNLIAMEREPDESSVRRNYLQRLSEKLDEVKPHEITFMHLDHEPTTARRLFMMIALFKKYISENERIRFLIAETDTSFTLLSALYFARFFGVEDNLEISPLFETDIALHRADKVISELLENAHYREYVERTGRLCIQVGYSDAGRFVGQVPASMAIERLKIKLLNLLAKEKMRDIEVVFFDTHGESIGRGGGQEKLSDRIAYFTPPYVRNLARHHDLNIVQETSFQGGDGFLFFKNEGFAFASLTRLLEELWKSPEDAIDSFYEEEDTTLEFFLNAKSFQNDLVENSAYVRLLGSFAQNFLYSTGSRAIKRQHEGKADRQLDHPSQLRAIPHNAILQQLGYLANSLGGVGCAFKKNMDQLIDMYQTSDRFKQLFSIAEEAECFSDTDSLDAYISVLDPMFWLKRAGIEGDRETRRKMRRIVRHLEEMDLSDSLRSIERLLIRDKLDFERCLSKLPNTKNREDKSKAELQVLHGIRIALMLQSLVLAFSIPRFSTRPNVSMEDVYEALFHFDIQTALDMLKDAFPLKSDETQWAVVEEDISYEHLHKNIFADLERTQDLFKKITVGIANHCSAIG